MLVRKALFHSDNTDDDTKRDRPCAIFFSLEECLPGRPPESCVGRGCESANWVIMIAGLANWI